MVFGQISPKLTRRKFSILLHLWCLGMVSLTQEIHGLMRVMWSGKWAVVTPHTVLSAVWTHIPSFRGYCQQDAQEFLWYVCCLLFVVYCLLFIVCCLLFVVYCLLFILFCVVSYWISYRMSY